MTTVLVTVITCIAIAQIQAQLLDDTNLNQMVPKSQVADKGPGCTTFDFVTVTGADGVEMVNRRFFQRLIPGFQPRTFECAPGTLFSLLSYLCVCSVRIADTRNRDRCIVLLGDMQGESDSIPGTQRTDVSTGATEPIALKVEGYYDATYIAGDACYANNVNIPLSMPFFTYNSLAQSQLDMRIGFRLAATSNDGTYKIATTGPCNDDSSPASFDLSYVRNGVSNGQIILSLRVASNLVVGATENTVQITCTIVSLNRGGGLADYVFNENAADNYVRIIGSTRSPNNMQIQLRNGILDASTDPTPPPQTGFCSPSVNVPISRRGQNLIIPPRRCPLSFGQAPDGEFMCVYAFGITRDCS